MSRLVAEIAPLQYDRALALEEEAQEQAAVAVLAGLLEKSVVRAANRVG